MNISTPQADGKDFELGLGLPKGSIEAAEIATKDLHNNSQTVDTPRS